MFVLGIDVGTTGTKALLVDEGGCVVSRGYSGYALITNPGGVVEQNADDWWDAVVAATAQASADLADKTQVCAISLSTQGASSLLVDEDGRPLGNALTWMDARAGEEKKQIEAAYPGDAIYTKTGWDLNASLDAAKLLWYQNNQADTLARAARYVSTIEYINMKLTGRPVIDPTNAAIRQLMDLNTGRWDDALIDFIGADKTLMPDILPTGADIGELSAQAADKLGLSRKTRVYNGAHDQYAATLGAGAVHAGDMICSTGTAWVTVGVTGQPMFTKSYIAPAPHVVSGLWGAMASLPVSGAALDWYRQTAGLTYEDINTQAAVRANNAKDVFFYPFLAGARFPIWNTDARAAFVGLGLEHDAFDMARAVMEGVVFQLKLALEDYTANGAAVKKLCVTGGATKSDLWLALIAAVLDMPITVSNEKDTAALGAAAIAAVGAGVFDDYRQAAQALASARPQDASGDDMCAFYQDKYVRYMDAWKQILKIYE